MTTGEIDWAICALYIQYFQEGLYVIFDFFFLRMVKTLTKQKNKKGRNYNNNNGNNTTYAINAKYN